MESLPGEPTTVASRWAGWLAVEEVERDPRLRMILAALLLYFYVTFYNWWRNAALLLSTKGQETFNAVPTWVFENWRGILFLDHFSMKVYLWLLGMTALVGVFALMYRPSCRLSMAILAFLFANKLLFYLMDLRLMANFHHLHLLYCAIFLISREKLFFFRLALLVSYEMSAIIKLTPSWLFGEYFNSVPGKLPLLPKNEMFVMLAMQSIIVMEVLGPLLWFSRKSWIRKASVVVFLIFHLYSGLLVGFKYTTLMLTCLVPAFLDFDAPAHSRYRYTRRDLAPILALCLCLVGGFWHFTIPGDARLTAEGRYLGVFMFDANRTVLFHTVVCKGDKKYAFWVKRPWRNGAILEDGTVDTDTEYEVWAEIWRGDHVERKKPLTGPVKDGDIVIFNPSFFTAAQMRTFGDPYLYYYYGKELTRRYQPDRISMELYQQLDGYEQAFKLLDIEDFQSLNPSYSGWRHNDWVRLPGDDAEASYRWW